MLKNLFAVPIVVVTLATTTISAYNPHGLDPHLVYGPDVIEHHSLEPPLLDNFLESGLRFWSFGGTTVVTDHYVRLSDAGHQGHGYLWNQFPSGLQSWQANFTWAFSTQKDKKGWGSGFLSGGEHCDPSCGAAFWFLSEPTRHAESRFFGVPGNFKGIGVVMPTNGERTGSMHIVQNDGNAAESSLDAITVAKCPINGNGGDYVHVTVTYSHMDETFAVSFAIASKKAEADGRTHTSDGSVNDRLYHYPCETVRDVKLSERYYYGFTAMSSRAHDLTVDLNTVVVSPFEGDKENLAVEEDALHNASAVQDWDAKLDLEDRKYWNANTDDVDRNSDDDGNNNLRKDPSADDFAFSSPQRGQRDQQQQYDDDGSSEQQQQQGEVEEGFDGAQPQGPRGGRRQRQQRKQGGGGGGSEGAREYRDRRENEWRRQQQAEAGGDDLE